MIFTDTKEICGKKMFPKFHRFFKNQINYQQVSASNQNIKIFLKNYLCIWSIAKFDSAKGHSNQFWLLCTTLVSHFGQLL
jgi:hypothetical protein